MTMQTTRDKNPAKQQGTAILIAMLVVGMVAMVSISATWFQWRNFSVEQSQRTQIQATWLLTGAVDWAKLILLEDLKADGRNNETTDNLSEPWAIPLRETKLSTFLALDKENNADIDLPVFLSGEMADAQARFNLRNLWGNGSRKDDRDALIKLFELLQISRGEADALLANLRASGPPSSSSDGTTGSEATGTQTIALDAKPLPILIEDIKGLGVSEASFEKLKPFITILPERTFVNLNTAEKETLLAVGIEPAKVNDWLESRKRKPLKQLEELKQQFGEELTLGTTATKYFYVTARIRIDDIAVREQFLIHRLDTFRARVVWRKRV